MSEDFIKRGFNAENAIKKTYYEINELLTEMGSSMDKFPSMPIIDTTSITTAEREIDLDEEKAIYKKMYGKMNDKQKEITKKIKKLLKNKNEYFNVNGIKTRCVFINGAGGTGKTFIYKALYHYSRYKGYYGFNTSFSGIASTLLPEGRTVHNLFKLPVPLHHESNSNIEAGTKQAKDIINSDYILIDEAPMLPRYAIEIINRKLSELKNDKTKSPFGNHLIITGGDFAQTLPILKGGSRYQQVDLSIKHSQLWKYFKVFELTENMRAEKDAKEFAKFIRNVGLGIKNFPNEPDGYCKLPKNRCTTDDLPNIIFGDIIKNEQYSKLKDTVLLATLNKEVNKLNEEVLNMFPGEEHIYKSIDSTTSDHENTIMPDMLNTCDSSRLPLHQLRIKKDSIIMLVNNLNVCKGLCNGTRLRVLKMHKRLIEVEVLTGSRAGTMFLLPRIDISDDLNFGFPVIRHQFPVKLAMCMTINKSQGQTFKQIGISLLSDVFSHGQLYTALSRAKSWDGILVQLRKESTNTLVKIVVYDEILQ